MKDLTTYSEFLNEGAGQYTKILKDHFVRTNMDLAKWIKTNLLPKAKLDTESDAVKLIGQVNSKKYFSKLPSMYFFDSPAFDYPSKGKIIHFVRSKSIRENILKNGFIYGEPNYLKIGMSWGSMETPNRKVGYNYGLDYDDMIEKYGTIEKAAKVWGGYPVVFNASDAIKNYHFGDDVEQVIFWGPSVTNITKVDI